MVCAVRNLQVRFLVWVSRSKRGAAISAIISLILARISCFRWTNKSPAFTWKDMGYRNQKIRVSKLSTHAPACTWQGYGACDWPCGKSPAFTWKDMGYRNQSIQVRKLSTCAPACTWQGYGACDWPCGKHFSLSRGSLSGWWCFYLAKSALKHLIMILYHVHSGHQWYMTSIHVECKVTLNILWHYQFFPLIHTSASTVY